MTDTGVLDDLDRRIVHALQIDGRVPFTVLGAVLGVSARTVARRYGRLRSTGTVRVVGRTVPSAGGRRDWLLRCRGDPGACAAAATVLARSDDARWVGIASGGVEVTAVVRDGGPGAAPVTRALPRAVAAAVAEAHCLLAVVAGRSGWPGQSRALDVDQVAALTPPRAPDASREPASPSEANGAFARGKHSTPIGNGAFAPNDEGSLLAALARDGRTSAAQLASVTGWSESTVRRRLDEMRERGGLHFEIDVRPAALGVGCEALLWLAVAPGRVRAVSTALDAHPAVAFAAVTSGPATMAAMVLCRDEAALADLLADDLGALPGVERIEAVPIAEHVKRAGALILPARPEPRQP